MRAEAEVQALRANGRGQLTKRVALGTHLHHCPIGEAGVVHGEAVVMLSHGNNVLRAGVLEELRPDFCVEVLGAEERNQVLVAL